MTHPVQHQTAGGTDREAQTRDDAVRNGGLAVYLLIGIMFGIVLVRGEVISLFRIQEMFRFQGFHM